MADNVPEPPTGRHRSRRRPSDRSIRIVVVLGIAFIFALVLLPYRFHQRFDGLYARRDRVIAPAEDRVDRIQFALAREVAAKRGYLLSNDPAFLARARRARDERDRALDSLDSLALRLGLRAVAVDQMDVLVRSAQSRAHDRFQRGVARGSAARREGRRADERHGANGPARPITSARPQVPPTGAAVDWR